ncbi:TlpA family protein disulfide reductase [Mesonia ostreae]|uniref:Uncharacterized protein n=1 Tax=Mesonia ostreae TaxID=861110 RepID=A0ABU2KFH9_9FLAO|nr:hypothetical protein [Mesonia ostreae]MDT0293461.1 hypothetical protein [Mesonia ostreae]
MKKFTILFVLFALPILAYLFFASGVNNFAKLPTITPQVKNLNSFSSFNGKPLQFKDKITILMFYGDNINVMEGNAFNLNEKIYDKNYNFNDFQFVAIAKDGQQQAAKDLLAELSITTDIVKWNFGFASAEAIQELFHSLETNLSLNEDLANTHAFIIDKNGSLRGRKGEDDHSKIENYGYNTSSVGELNNVMDDDVKVILAEYRLALKKYNK